MSRKGASSKKKRAFEEVNVEPVVPLSEQINALFTPQVAQDPDDGELFFDEGFAAPRGPMLGIDEQGRHALHWPTGA